MYGRERAFRVEQFKRVKRGSIEFLLRKQAGKTRGRCLAQNGGTT